MTVLNFIFVLIALFYVLILPGFILSYVIADKRAIDLVERVALSIALSISVIPLFVFYLSELGVKVTTLSVLIEILLIVVFSSTILLIKRVKTQK